MMNRFGISLGFGDKTVEQVCEENHVDCVTFLAMANFLSQGKEVASYFIDKVSVRSLMEYLSRSHTYYLNFFLPYIRRHLIESINYSENNKVSFLIVKFYDEYMAEVKRHMEMENKKVFPGVQDLLDGKPKTDFHILSFYRSHEGMDNKLIELRNIIIKYYNIPSNSHQDPLYIVLQQIFTMENDLRSHCEIEDTLFVPAVECLEEKVSKQKITHPEKEPAERKALSDREVELVRCVVRGLSNKEIAQELFISVNTVITHRKNIARKLNIHSASGLTIYAIVNGLVNLDEVKNLI